jgi:acyl-CoA thioesterase
MSNPDSTPEGCGPALNAPPSSSSNDHPFDRGVALQAVGAGQFRGTASPDYWNRVGPFGGMTAAMMLNSTLIASERLGDPIALTVNYAAPMAMAEYQINASAVRTNRTTQHWTMALMQDQQTVATGSAVFGLRRPSWHRAEVTMPSDLPGADSLTMLERAMPMTWFKQYDLRPIRSLGSLADPQVSTHAWIRDQPPRALDYPSLVAICDSVMPWMFRRRKELVPISTVSLSVYFHVSSAELATVGSDHVYTKAYGQICHTGYKDSNAQIWSRDGVLLATTQQMMWVKD